MENKDIISLISNEIHIGTQIKKPSSVSSVLKIEPNKENAFLKYSIGKMGSSKTVSQEEFIEAFKKIKEDGYINRMWYVEKFPYQHKNKPCNFTTIGGVFEILKIVTYKNGYYK